MRSLWVFICLVGVAIHPVFGDIRYDGDIDPLLEEWAWSLDDPIGGTHSSDGDILTSTDSGSEEYRFTLHDAFDQTIGYTIEIRARNVSGPSGDGRIVLVRDDTYDEGIYMGAGGDNQVVRLRRKTGYLNLAVDTTQFHVYRLTRLGDQVALYIDDVLMDSGTSTNTDDGDYVRFGSASGSNIGTVEVDYLHVWTSGAYAPGAEPTLNPVMNAGFSDFTTVSPTAVVATMWEQWYGDTHFGGAVGNLADTYLEEEGLWWLHSRSSSQRMYEPNKLFDCGLRQRLPVTEGDWISFSCWLNHYFEASGPDADLYYQVGIDPDGDTDVAGTQWSFPVLAPDAWHQVAVARVMAATDHVMLYVRAYLPADAPLPGGYERDVFIDDALVISETLRLSDVEQKQFKAYR
jgi:hypothetical protein